MKRRLRRTGFCMMKLSYDLHLHSCLSPCGDDEMTPNNIVHMAVLKGLQIIALTDHNSCKNCPAFLEVARESGILAVPGMELCTSEEIHVVCLFPDLAAALAFDAVVEGYLPDIANRPEIFGQQLILGAQDEPIGVEPRLLVNATTLPVQDVPALVDAYGGFCFPAHVDKSAYSILSNLGSIPAECRFSAVEVKNPQAFLISQQNRGKIVGMRVLTNSDAHYLWDIAEPQRFIELETCSARGLLSGLRGADNRKRSGNP